MLNLKSSEAFFSVLLSSQTNILNETKEKLNLLLYKILRIVLQQNRNNMVAKTQKKYQGV